MAEICLDRQSEARHDRAAARRAQAPTGLMALYEGSIWSVRWVEKKAAADKAKDAASAAAKPPQ
jgi:hypothetical protein